MGATDSKSHHDTAHLQDKTDTVPGEDPGNHTPVSNRRLVKLKDPRSPTDDVQRTPIIVPKPGAADDSFEDPRSPTVKIARTPIPDTDPRSPTAGMSRTPCPFTYPDPRSPTTNVARTPMLKEPGSGKFEMPSVDENDKIEEEVVEEKDEGELEEEDKEEVQNASNNNSGDTARLIDRSQPDEEPIPSSLVSEPQKPPGDTELNVPNGPTAEESTNEIEDDDTESRSLIASGKGPSKKSRRASLTKSIRAKINRSNSAPPRSPLSTRNLEKDAPVVHVRAGDGVITFDKAGSRRRQASGTPTRLVGKYEPIMPMLDKENI